MLVSNNKPLKWIRPWDEEKPNNLYNRDERFFSVVTKGLLAYLTNTICMYGKPIKHFILSTGTDFMYVETNGYEYKIGEVTGEDMMYMERPRCILNLSDISIDTGELTQKGVRGTYERLDDNNIRGFNAEIKRMPIKMSFNLHYVLSTFNEQITLAQEIIEKMLFQTFFSFVYLGQIIQASVVFPDSTTIEVGKIDVTSSEANANNIDFSVIVETNYPQIDQETEIPNDAFISGFYHNTAIRPDIDGKLVTDNEEHTII